MHRQRNNRGNMKKKKFIRARLKHSGSIDNTQIEKHLEDLDMSKLNGLF